MTSVVRLLERWSTTAYTVALLTLSAVLIALH